MFGPDPMASIFGLSMAKTAGRIPDPVLDEDVVMRFAELVDERKLPATIRQAAKKWRGNDGAISLLYHRKAIIARIGSLKPDPERLQWSKLLKRHTRKAPSRWQAGSAMKSGKLTKLNRVGIQF